MYQCSLNEYISVVNNSLMDKDNIVLVPYVFSAELYLNYNRNR